MKKIDWKVKLIFVFIISSIVVYSIHYLIFRDEVYIFRILIAQLGFLPLSTILVTFILNEVLSRRDKHEMMQKLNMQIGSFFSEVGNELLGIISKESTDLFKRNEEFIFTKAWTENEFKQLCNKVKKEHIDVALDSKKIIVLRDLLLSKRTFMLFLLQNPNLLEHEAFTDMLWSLFHLTEELSNRKNLESLSTKDIEHLSGDVSRMYTNLIIVWLSYIEHLQNEYPYLFSLAIRSNPFDKNAKVEF
ncbi:MAG: hypothetical protein ACERLG_01725 [Sedimentibacter sp.]